MSKSVYWCEKCEIPIIESSSCPICSAQTQCISTNGICNPVFLQEKRLISCILDKDIVSSNIWYLGSSYYLIDGKRVRVPYTSFYKKREHLNVAEKLRNNVSNNSDIHNYSAFIKANLNYLNKLVYEAEEYVTGLVQTISKTKDTPFIPTVSFSGGKDSTVVSRIVRDALQNESIIHFFGDTTLEFPATHTYVEETFREENPFTPMIPSETDKDFFKLCNVFGPPSKLERWCCTIFKTGNLNTEYQNLTGNSLSFLGIRRSESQERRKYERTQDHSKIGSQINAMPIIDWCDFDVWLYILNKKIEFNDAYKWGYKRVGCWCCPNNSDWSTMLTDIYYPVLSQKWKAVLYDFAKKTDKSDIEDYVNNGRWKVRKGASGLEAKNTSIEETPCNLSDRARNLIINKKIAKDIVEFFKPFGRISLSEGDGTCHIIITENAGTDFDGVYHQERKMCELIITWGTPVVKVLPSKSTDLQLLLNRLKCQLRKYQYCIKCSACDSLCPYGAINTMGDSRYKVDENKCIGNTNICSRCIAKFYNGCITCQVLAGKK